MLFHHLILLPIIPPSTPSRTPSERGLISAPPHHHIHRLAILEQCLVRLLQPLLQAELLLRNRGGRYSNKRSYLCIGETQAHQQAELQVGRGQLRKAFGQAAGEVIGGAPPVRHDPPEWWSAFVPARPASGHVRPALSVIPVRGVAGASRTL